MPKSVYNFLFPSRRNGSYIRTCAFGMGKSTEVELYRKGMSSKLPRDIGSLYLQTDRESTFEHSLLNVDRKEYGGLLTSITYC